MKTWNVQVGASDKVEKDFDTLQQVLKWLKKCQGSCSVYYIPSNREKFSGTVDQAIDWIEFRTRDCDFSGTFSPGS
jgi:hypothetical protein